MKLQTMQEGRPQVYTGKGACSLVTCKALLLCPIQKKHQCNALVLFCVIRLIGKGRQVTVLPVAAVTGFVVEPCSNEAADYTYDKRCQKVLNHKSHLPRCREIPMVRGSGKNSIAQNHGNVRVT